MCGLKLIRFKLISKKMMGLFVELFIILCEEGGIMFEGCCVFLFNINDWSIFKYGSKFKLFLD